MNSIKNSHSQCPICDSGAVRPLLNLPQQPVISNVLWASKEDAISVKRGDICLFICQICGHIFNHSFDPGLIEYNLNYENSLNFSEIFSHYASQIANHLVDRYSLKKKNIVEIGCGKGDFLKLLCDIGENRGTGFDPSVQPGVTFDDSQVKLIPDYFSEKYQMKEIDLLCSRHTLEHISNPKQFLRSIVDAISPEYETIFFFEVPNMQYILQETSIWDIIYEHFSYFCGSSLKHLFQQLGIHILHMYDTYNGQFLCLEAVNVSRPGSSIDFPIPAYLHLADSFSKSSLAKIDRWKMRIDELERDHIRTVVWGAGSKGISFLNMVGVGNAIQYIVDINPRKENMYITGSGQQIVSPQFLQEYQPDTVILMNSIYQSEVKHQLQELGLTSEIILAD